MAALWLALSPAFSHSATENKYIYNAINTQTFPTKSIYNNAPVPQSYQLGSGLLGVGDPNAVHGSVLNNGMFVTTGVGLRDSLHNAHAILYDPSGVHIDKWESTARSQGLCSVPVPGQNAVLISGFSDVVKNETDRSNPNWIRYKQSLTKLKINGSKLVEAWTATFDWSNRAANVVGDTQSAFEFVEYDPYHRQFVMVGFDQYPSTCGGSHCIGGYRFKSGGNVGTGRSVVKAIPLSKVVSDVEPTDLDVTFMYSDAEYTSSKAVRTLSDGTIITASRYNGENETKQLDPVGYGCGLTSINGSTGLKMSTQRFPTDCTDVLISKDGSSIIGGGFKMSKTYKGIAERQGVHYFIGTIFSTSTELLNGETNWFTTFTSTDYEVAGNYSYMIKNECWGLARDDVNGGYVVACGTGIEDCRFPPNSTESERCEAGLVDERPGAQPRHKSVWQAMTVKVSEAGQLVWRRVDQHGENLEHSSAAEYVTVRQTDGMVGVITDETTGTGLLLLNPALSEPFAFSGSPNAPHASPPPPTVATSPSPSAPAPPNTPPRTTPATPPTTPPPPASPLQASSIPWWTWPAIGIGIVLLAYCVYRVCKIAEWEYRLPGGRWRPLRA